MTRDGMVLQAAVTIYCTRLSLGRETSFHDCAREAMLLVTEVDQEMRRKRAQRIAQQADATS